MIHKNGHSRDDVDGDNDITSVAPGIKGKKSSSNDKPLNRFGRQK